MTSPDKGPVTFTATNAEAHRDGDSVMLEMHAGPIRMVFACEPRSALELAHQIERAFHQRALPYNRTHQAGASQ